jgi:hypothetical protein
VLSPRATERARRHITSKHTGGAKRVRVYSYQSSYTHLRSTGYLFFTSVGILYGFKKPLAFFDFAAIDSISYTAVLRNTFNLVITTPSQEIEFGMLDQADFAGINDYVQTHGLQDASMAADRRAKKLNVNPPATKGSGENGTAVAVPDAAGGAEEEESELQKAERMLQDEEDDEEEDDDFDPGSEGESEGSGSESEDDDGEGGGYDEDGDEDEDGEDEEMEG